MVVVGGVRCVWDDALSRGSHTQKMKQTVDIMLIKNDFFFWHNNHAHHDVRRSVYLRCWQHENVRLAGWLCSCVYRVSYLASSSASLYRSKVLHFAY